MLDGDDVGILNSILNAGKIISVWVSSRKTAVVGSRSGPPRELTSSVVDLNNVSRVDRAAVIQTSAGRFPELRWYRGSESS